MFCVSVKLHPQDNHPPSSFSSPTRRVSSVRCFRNNRCSPLSPPCLPARAELMFLHWWSPAGFLFFLITLCARGRRWTRGGGRNTQFKPANQMAPPPKIHVKPRVCSSNLQQITLQYYSRKSFGCISDFWNQSTCILPAYTGRDIGCKRGSVEVKGSLWRSENSQYLLKIPLKIWPSLIYDDSFQFYFCIKYWDQDIAS